MDQARAKCWSLIFRGLGVEESPAVREKRAGWAPYGLFGGCSRELAAFGIQFVSLRAPANQISGAKWAQLFCGMAVFSRNLFAAGPPTRQHRAGPILMPRTSLVAPVLHQS